MKPVNHRILNVAFAGMLGGFAAASALAAVAMPDFKAADSNGDGMINPVEFAAVNGQEQAFREADANHDNRLSSIEYTRAIAINDRVKAGKFIDDAWITAKVKAMLLKDEGVKGLNVGVDTYKGTVQLSGWVDNASQVSRAEKIALSVEGVKGVLNNLLIKS